VVCVAVCSVWCVWYKVAVRCAQRMLRAGEFCGAVWPVGGLGMLRGRRGPYAGRAAAGRKCRVAARVMHAHACE